MVYTDKSEQEIINGMLSVPLTSQSLQRALNVYYGYAPTQYSVQELFAVKAGIPLTSKSLQEMLFNNVSTALGLTGSYTQYSEQQLFSRAVVGGLSLAQIVEGQEETFVSYLKALANLGLYYPLDETSGTTTFNRAPATEGTLNGTINGATINNLTMANGPAYSFDGNDFITLPTAASMKGESLISFVTIIRCPTATVGDKIFYQEPINTSSSSRLTFGISTGNTKLVVAARADDSVANSAWVQDVGLVAGNDYIVGANVDVANKTCKFFVNGVEVASTGTFAAFNSSTIANTNPNSGPYLGKNAASNAFFNSLMQHFFVTKGRLLTAAEHLRLAELSGFFF